MSMNIKEKEWLFPLYRPHEKLIGFHNADANTAILRWKPYKWNSFIMTFQPFVVLCRALTEPFSWLCNPPEPFQWYSIA